MNIVMPCEDELEDQCAGYSCGSFGNTLRLIDVQCGEMSMEFLAPCVRKHS
jgi:hypothetical protein